MYIIYIRLLLKKRYILGPNQFWLRNDLERIASLAKESTTSSLRFYIKTGSYFLKAMTEIGRIYLQLTKIIESRISRMPLATVNIFKEKIILWKQRTKIATAGQICELRLNWSLVESYTLKPSDRFPSSIMQLAQEFHFTMTIFSTRNIDWDVESGSLWMWWSYGSKTSTKNRTEGNRTWNCSTEENVSTVIACSAQNTKSDKKTIHAKLWNPYRDITTD